MSGLDGCMVACSVAGMSESPSIRRQLASGLSSESRPTTYESRMPDETQSCGSVLSAPAWVRARVRVEVRVGLGVGLRVGLRAHLT